MLTAHVADAMVREINADRRGPVTGRKLAFAIQTGDNSDNGQYNELRWNIDSSTAAPWPSTPATDEVTRASWTRRRDFYDPQFWHPDGTPPGKADDDRRAKYGFPTVPGLLDAARAAVRGPGLAMPWYSAMGNHDGLVQGNFPHTDAYSDRGGRHHQADDSGRPRTVTADPRPPPARQVGSGSTSTSRPPACPVGHGFTAENRAKTRRTTTSTRAWCASSCSTPINRSRATTARMDSNAVQPGSSGCSTRASASWSCCSATTRSQSFDGHRALADERPAAS